MSSRVQQLCRVFVFLCVSASLASAQASITAVRVPDAIAGGGGAGTIGSPYALYVQIRGWTAAASGQAYVKLYAGSTNEYMWSATGAWSNSTSYASTNQPVVTIDASGNWSGWIYVKHNDALGATAAVRAAKVGATSTNLTSATKTFTILTTSVTGNGGWIVRSSSSAVDKGIVAFSGDAMVGSYRTEDNGIVEGYSSGAGGFKIAVPIGVVDSLVAYNDDGTRFQAFVGPWVIGAGQETEATSGGGPIGRGTASLHPATLQGGRNAIVTEKIFGQSPHAIRVVRIAVPANWLWSRSGGDITLIGGGSPTASVVGDTVVVSGLSLGGGDSVAVRIGNIIPYDSTALAVFATKTGAHPDSVYAIAYQPSVFVYGTPVPISYVKENDTSGVPLRNNALVTVRGIVTVANQFGGPSYIQDHSGGMAVFGSTFSRNVTIGDEVIVSGLVQPFRGLCEIVSPILHTVMGSGNALAPVQATAAQIANDGRGGIENYEGRLVRITGVTVTVGGTWQANTNYQLTDPTGTVEMRIDDSTNIVGSPIPGGAFDIVGVVGQFVLNPPFIGGYQLMPRSTSDIISSGPIIATQPVESNILPTSLTITWRTLFHGTTRVRFGRTPALELGTQGNDTLQTSHRVVLSGLLPATAYYVRPFSVSGSDTSASSVLVASTASPSQSSGVINVYFNKSVNTNVAWFQPALGNQNLVQRIITRIGGARRSVDVALYSLSGQPGTDIANALVAAKNRGVKIRVICEDDNRNTSAFNFIFGNGILLITDRYDPNNNGLGLMHNKFFVIDGRGGAPDSMWVWNGSWNPTDPGTNADYQNAMEIQDAALANAYTMEFNEMWGSSGDVPNAANSRFGARKQDDTPHRFVIGGRQVECYFSPSDGTNAKIIGEINRAERSVGIQLLTLTRSDIANAIIGRKNAGVRVRGDIDDSTDTGSQFRALRNNGIDVRLKTGSGLLHHKYGIIDAENPGGNSVTITGSHNWTSSAENFNNENTLIVRDGNIANQYLQEFAARYYQFGGNDSIRVRVEEEEGIPASFVLAQNYPNPFNPSTTLSFSVPSVRAGQSVSLSVFDLLGREVASLVNGHLQAGGYKVELNASGLASGVYFYRLQSGEFSLTKKLMILR